jgi:hypothetical protein
MMVEFASDRMSYIKLRALWFHTIVLNVHAQIIYYIYYMKDSFYEELERIYDKFPMYYMKMLLGDFNAKVGREDSFKMTIGKERLHEIIMIMELE